MYGVCKICGCTENDPCYHPNWGMCWWADDSHELCSHCADPEIAEDPTTTHRVNSNGMPNDCVDISEECFNCMYMEREENTCILDKCNFKQREDSHE